METTQINRETTQTNMETTQTNRETTLWHELDEQTSETPSILFVIL